MDEDSSAMFPVPRTSRWFELWALGHILIIFGMVRRDRRAILFRRVETLLHAHGVI